MEYYFAPLEGITGWIYRSAHAKYFPGLDRYYTPFIAANQTHKMKTREKKDVVPANNALYNCIPQVLTKVPGSSARWAILKSILIWAALSRR